MRSRKSSGSDDCDVKLLGHLGSLEEDRRVVSSVDRCGVWRGRGFEEMRGAAVWPRSDLWRWAAKRGDGPDDQIRSSIWPVRWEINLCSSEVVSSISQDRDEMPSTSHELIVFGKQN